MKKIFKNGLLGLLVVMFSLCCVSCGDDDKPFMPYGGYLPSNDNDFFGYSYMFEPDRSIQLTFSTYSNPLQVVLSDIKGVITAEGYFDTVKFEEAQEEIPGDNGCWKLPHNGDPTDVAVYELIEKGYLPSGNTWTLTLSNATDETRNLEWTVDPTVVATINAWLLATKPE